MPNLFIVKTIYQSAKLQVLKSFWTSLLFILQFINPVYGQMGRPPQLNIASSDLYSEDYTSSPQNWGVIQHQDGRIFLGNTSGVLSWDGHNWELIAGTENKRFFKFASDGQGRIYTAGKEDLGYIGSDALGKPTFVSLKKHLPKSVQDFDLLYRVASDGDRIFFLGGSNLFCWSNNAFKVWEREPKFSRVFISENRVFISTKDELLELVDDELVTVIKPSQLAELQLRGLAVLHHPQQGSGLWFATERHGLYSFFNHQLYPLNPGLDSLEVMNVCQLEGGDFALGTNGQGLYIVNLAGEVIKLYNTESGLLDNQIPFPYQGNDNSIWVCQYTGLSRIAYPSPFELYGIHDKSVPLVLSTYQWQGKIFIGTIQGVFLIEDPLTGIVSREELDCGPVHNFFSLDGSLWMVAVHGIYQYQDGLGFLSSHVMAGVENSCRSASDSTTLYLSSNDLFLRTLRYRQGRWDKGVDSIAIPHFGLDMVQDQDGSIWFAYDKVSKVRFTETGPVLQTFGIEQGLPPSEALLEIQSLAGELVVTGDIGIYSWQPDQERFVPFTKWGEEFASGKHHVYNLTPISKGDAWITSNKFTGLLKRDSTGRTTLDSLLLASFPVTDYFSIYEAPTGEIWLGGTEGLIRYNPAIPIAYHQEFQTLIRGVLVNRDSTIFHGSFDDGSGLLTSDQPSGMVPALSYEENDLTFRYAAPYFEAMEQLKFSHQLVGQDADWGPWSTKTETEYTNIREGDYTFQVKARNVYGTIGKIATYRFSVAPPWYRTWWAFTAYTILIVLGVVLLVYLNTRRLLAAKRRLEGIVEERTEEIKRQMKQLANQKEVIHAEKEKSEQLLLNILPKATTEELKENGAARPRYFEHTSVLFTDFKGFTQIAEALSPEDLVNEIHTSFSEFDRITRRHGIEKIKTIGDAYMAAGGLPTSNTTHPIDVVTAALEIRDFMQSYHQQRVEQGLPGFEIRLGVHTGPVVAGIVGLHKFQYDIWGDTVNTASRMESSGEVWKVNISQSTYELVKDHFQCTYRGKIEAKNKGEIAMYFVDWLG